MKGFVPLVLGIFGTFAFSWVGLILIPNLQIGHLDPQSDEEGTDIYPMPQSGMVERGRHIYAANGCVYCHSEQLRAEYAAADLDREREAAPQPQNDGRAARAFDASEGTPLDPLRNKTYDLNYAKTVPAIQ